jgi:hypothetical protein
VQSIEARLRFIRRETSIASHQLLAVTLVLDQVSSLIWVNATSGGWFPLHDLSSKQRDVPWPTF